MTDTNTRPLHCPRPRNRPAVALLAPALAVIAAALVLPGVGAAQKHAGLEGAWSGSGSVSFASGAKEQARCRAHYRRRSNTSYTLTATCATASVRASQTANLRKVAENRYQGSFYNSEYGVSGTIQVVVRGGSQSVRLISDSGWAVFRLSR